MKTLAIFSIAAGAVTFAFVGACLLWLALSVALDRVRKPADGRPRP